MCGIFAIFGSPKSDDALRKVAIKCAKKLRHRGPDWSGCYCKARLSAVAARPPPVSHTRASREARWSNRTGWQRTRVSFWPQDGVAIVHERLAIVDPESGAQPMYSNDRTIVLGVNGDQNQCRTSPALLREAPSATGEIWNHRAIRAETKGALGAHKYATQSDCEVPLPAPGTTLVTCASRSASVAPVNPQGAKQSWAGHHPTVPGVRLGPRRPSRRHVRLCHVTRATALAGRLVPRLLRAQPLSYRTLRFSVRLCRSARCSWACGAAGLSSDTTRRRRSTSSRATTLASARSISATPTTAGAAQCHRVRQREAVSVQMWEGRSHSRCRCARKDRRPQ